MTVKLKVTYFISDFKMHKNSNKMNSNQAQKSFMSIKSSIIYGYDIKSMYKKASDRCLRNCKGY